MPDCSVCGYPALNQRALGQHFRVLVRGKDPSHLVYRSRDVFAGQIEGVDYVRCRVCGMTAVALGQHLVAKHGINAVQYRERFGVDASTRSAKTRAKASASRVGQPCLSKGRTKPVPCNTCGTPFEMPLVASTQVSHICPSCKQIRDGTAALTKQQSWDGKSEPEDYVTCRVCGHRSASLASHIQSRHPELSGRYRVVFQGAPVLCNANRRVIGAVSSARPRSDAWKQHQSLTQRKRFTLKDFAPYMEPDRTLDHHAAAKGLGVGLPIIRRCAKELGVPRTRRHSLGRADYKKVILTETELAPFKLKNGKVAVGKAARALGYNHLTVLKNCVRLCLPVAHRAISQELFLDTVSRALGGCGIHPGMEPTRIHQPEDRWEVPVRRVLPEPQPVGRVPRARPLHVSEPLPPHVGGLPEFPRTGSSQAEAGPGSVLPHCCQAG